MRWKGAGQKTLGKVWIGMIYLLLGGSCALVWVSASRENKEREASWECYSAYAAEKRLTPPEEEPSRTQVEAFWAEPFGVARVSLVLPPSPTSGGYEAILISEPQGRVFYPAVQEGPLRAFLREKTGLTGGRSTVYFLFTGKEPLEVRLRTLAGSWTVRVIPGEHPRRFGRLLAEWWRCFAPDRGRSDEEDPLGVEAYLRTMLARRLRLPGPGQSDPVRGLRRLTGTEQDASARQRAESSWGRSLLGAEWSLLFGLDALREEVLHERLEGRDGRWREPLAHPLPAPSPSTGGNLPEPKEPPQIEPLAHRVPEECYYIRFGNMANFAWFREFLDWAAQQWTLSTLGWGLDYQIMRRSEERLCLRPTGWSKWLGREWGGRVENLAVADVALVGLDLFQRDGAAVGVLFQARSEQLLGAELQKQRAEAIRAGQGKIREERLTIEAREVSLLTSADGRIRSFYVADGGWHLVSTSRRLVERFLQTRSGQGALAGAPDFRAIRSKYPSGASPTAFWYFSDAFWRNLTSPAYQVEIRRRLQAEADVLLVEMARQAAAAEGRPAERIEQLVAGGFLPPRFGPRSDGTQAVLREDAVWDSLRGRRGYFTPVADVQIAGITPTEAQMLQQYAQSVATARNRASPLVVVFHRAEEGQNTERITLDIYTVPLRSAVLESLSGFLGSASSERMAPVPGDVAFVELRLPQGRLFLGLQDTHSAELRLGRGKLLLSIAPPAPQLLLRALLVGYVGRQGEAPLLDALDRLLGGRPDAEGYTGKPGGLWRRQQGNFLLYSFQKEILDQVGPHLRLEKTDQPAQIRMSMKDLSHTQLGHWFHDLAYERARQAIQANLRLLTLLENQFHLAGPAAWNTAEQWLQARLVCPLGGRYEYREFGPAGPHWIATALAGTPASAPETSPKEQPRPLPPPLLLPLPNKPVPPGAEAQTPSSPPSFGNSGEGLAPPLDWFRGLEGWACWQEREAEIFLSFRRQTKPAPSGGPAPGPNHPK